MTAAPRSNTRRRCQAPAPCQVFTVILGRTPGFQQSHLRGHQKELAGRRSLKVSGNPAPSRALRVADLPVAAGGAHLSLLRWEFVSDKFPPSDQSLCSVWGPCPWLCRLLLAGHGPERVLVRCPRGPWVTPGSQRLSGAAPPAPHVPPSEGCRTMGQWDNGTIDGGAGEIPGAEESPVLCLGTQRH